MDNKQNLIKIFDLQKADKLAEMGFKYILDSVNGQIVYAFFISKELMEYINSNFETTNFFYDNMLRF